MAAKTPKSLVVERSCPSCEGRITFPDDVKTVLCPKCRKSFRVYKEDGRAQLREPDRKDDLAALNSEIEQTEFEIGLLLEKVERFEKLSLLVLGLGAVPLVVMIYALFPISKADWNQFAVGAVMFAACLFGAYWTAFNPTTNRKIMKMYEERITLRRRRESL